MSKRDEKIMKKGEVATSLYQGASSELIKLRKENRLPRIESMQLSDVDIDNCPNLQKLLRSYPESRVMDFAGTPIINVQL